MISKAADHVVAVWGPSLLILFKSFMILLRFCLRLESSICYCTTWILFLFYFSWTYLIKIIIIVYHDRVGWCPMNRGKREKKIRYRKATEDWNVPESFVSSFTWFFLFSDDRKWGIPECIWSSTWNICILFLCVDKVHVWRASQNGKPGCSRASVMLHQWYFTMGRFLYTVAVRGYNMPFTQFWTHRCSFTISFWMWKRIKSLFWRNLEKDISFSPSFRKEVWKNCCLLRETHQASRQVTRKCQRIVCSSTKSSPRK